MDTMELSGINSNNIWLIPDIGFGSVNGIYDPSLVSSSVLSFPWKPLCFRI